MSDVLRAELLGEGFTDEAIDYALRQLKEAPDIRRPLPYCRAICRSFDANEAPLGCDDCVGGWLLEEAAHPMGFDAPLAHPCRNCRPDYFRGVA